MQRTSLTNLVQMFDDCDKLQNKDTALTAAEQLDMAIRGALSGHPSLVSYCEANGGWRDILWALLRCTLVATTSKAIIGGGRGSLSPHFSLRLRRTPERLMIWPHRLSERSPGTSRDGKETLDTINAAVPSY